MWFIRIIVLCCLISLDLWAQESVDPSDISQLIERANELTTTNADSARILARKGVELALINKDRRLIADAYDALGNTFYYQAEVDSALGYFEESRDIFLELGDSVRVANVISAIAELLNDNGKYQEALETYLEALSYVPGNDEDEKVSRLVIFANLGSSYSDLEEFEKAIEYCEESLAISEALGRDDYVAMNWANLAFNLIEINDLKPALDFATKAHSYYKNTDNEWIKGGLLFLMGKAHLAMGELAHSKSYLDSAIISIKGFGDWYFQALIYLEQAKYYRKSYSYSKARSYADSALNLAVTHSLRSEQLIATKLLSEIYAGLGRHEEAYRYLKQSQELGDTLFNEKKSAQMKDMEARYQTEQKEQQIALQSSQLTQQSQLRNGLIAGLILVIVIGGLIFRSERIKTKKNRQIESLLKEIHHRVKNNLQVISSLLNMQARGVDDMEVLETIKEGQSRVKAMSLIHQRLYQTDEISEIDLQEYISELAGQLKDLYLGGDSRVITQISADGVKLDLDTAIPLGLILNELISNAYKYAFVGADSGEIKIDLQRLEGDQLKLEVSDNGIGLPSGVNLEKVKSLGLKLVNMLTRQLKGNISYESIEGSRFVINFTDLRAN